MAIVLPQGLRDLIGQVGTGLRNGFQQSHVIGEALARDRMMWLADIGLDYNDDFNLKPRPEAMRGSAVLEVAAHNGKHVKEIDLLKYDPNPSTKEDSGKFLNVIERLQREEILRAVTDGKSAIEIEAIKKSYRIQVMNAVDFWTTLELYPDQLEKLGDADLKSVAFNKGDPRTLTEEVPLKTHLRSPEITRLFDYQTMVDNTCYQYGDMMRIKSIDTHLQ
jgi:hypothetical protein